jgi:hypothetical protein
MKKYCPLIFASALAALTSPVIAGSLNYTYVSAMYSKFSSDIQDYSEDLEGKEISLDFSYAVRSNLALVAGYGRGEANLALPGSVADADTTTVTYGLLGHAAIDDDTDFILGARFINGKADINIDGTFYQRVDRDGGVAFIGIRTMTLDDLELNVFIQKRSVEDRTNWGVKLAAAYYITKKVSLDLGYALDADDNVIALSITRYF